MIVNARFVVPVDSPPIENGGVQFDEGRILAVGRAERLAGAADADLGDAAILPGLVNAHTHLELSLLAGLVPPSHDFVGWLRRLIAARTSELGGESEPEGQVSRAVRAGIAQSVAAGVTTLGDITAFPQWTRPVLAGSALRSVSFGEVIAIGQGQGRLLFRLEAAAELRWQTDNLRVGISPHAPYTLAPEGLEACARRARDMGAPLCIHVAETADEELFTRRGVGPFADFLRELGLWNESIVGWGCSPVELLSKCGLLGPTTVLAHANYVSEADLALIRDSGASVAYCPRTHAAFGHEPHRFRDMIRAGMNVCLGTDSLASSPSLSVLDEMRFLRARCPDAAPLDLLAMGSIRGARALGLGRVCGSLAAGKSADLVAVPLPTGASNWEDILESTAAPIAVYAQGRLMAQP